MGERANYREISSCLCKSGNPKTVVDSLLTLHAFTTLYIADLDAIEGKSNNSAVIKFLSEAYPSLQLWIDAGFRDAPAITRFSSRNVGIAVLGSESLVDIEVLHPPHSGSAILSLDFLNEQPLGSTQIHARPEYWPPHTIAMNIAHVGSAQGPDFATIARLKAIRPDIAWYAAGGVRGVEDLQTLSCAGVAGVLVASALHSGQLHAGTLAAYV